MQNAKPSGLTFPFRYWIHVVFNICSHKKNPVSKYKMQFSLQQRTLETLTTEKETDQIKSSWPKQNGLVQISCIRNLGKILVLPVFTWSHYEFVHGITQLHS